MCLSEMGLSCRRGASPPLSAKSAYESLMLISDNTILVRKWNFESLMGKFQQLSFFTKRDNENHIYVTTEQKSQFLRVFLRQKCFFWGRVVCLEILKRQTITR